MNKLFNIYSILREPLLHFLLIGAGLFFIYYQLNDSTSDDENQIHITKANLDMLDKQWIDTKGRAPSAEEKKSQLDNFIQEEILYREALSKGLDKNDKTIHTHLAKKMKFILDDRSIISEPTDAELKEFLSKNSSKFTEPASISFNQVLFTKTAESKDINEDAQEFLKRLKKSTSPKVSTVGDLVELTKKGITNIYGEEFAYNIFSISEKSWQGPVESKRGIHLIYIHSRKDATLPEFSKIKKLVTIEWRRQKRDEANKIFYKELRKNYQIIIDEDTK